MIRHDFNIIWLSAVVWVSKFDSAENKFCIPLFHSSAFVVLDNSVINNVFFFNDIDLNFITNISQILYNNKNIINFTHQMNVKHVNICHHYFWQCISNKKFNVEWISIIKQTTKDLIQYLTSTVFTKILGWPSVFENR